MADNDKTIGFKDIKNELTNDEKILESAFKFETLYKKHKLKLWSVIILTVGLFGGMAVMDKIHSDKLIEANEAFLVLQSNSQDNKALDTLKKNNFALYELYRLNLAVKNKDVEILQSLSHSKNSVVADISTYSESVLALNPNEDTKIYPEMALFEGAYLDIKKGKNKEAKNKLELIDEQSSFGQMAKFLRHATVKVN